MYKQSEAMSRICPIIKGITWIDSYGNPLPNPIAAEKTFCIGDACMLWRWDTPKKGYCGLGGKP